MSERVVFWDIDGTLIEGSLERRFVALLRRTGRIRYSKLLADVLST